MEHLRHATAALAVLLAPTVPVNISAWSDPTDGQEAIYVNISGACAVELLDDGLIRVRLCD